MTLDKALKEEPRLKEMMKRQEVGDLINTARSLEASPDMLPHTLRESSFQTDLS